jgi:hypothetical protein
MSIESIIERNAAAHSATSATGDSATSESATSNSATGDSATSNSATGDVQTFSVLNDMKEMMSSFGVSVDHLIDRRQEAK